MGPENPPQSEKQMSENKDALLSQKMEALQKSALVSDQKLDVALLLLGRKPAAWVGDHGIIESDERRKQLAVELQQEYETDEALLKELGLFYHPKPVQEKEYVMAFGFVTAQDEEILAQAVKADQDKDDKAFGLLMGYPETAVASHGTDEGFNIYEELSREELKILTQEGVLSFMNFKPSRKHWNEELNFVRENQRLIKEISPALYQEIITKC